MEPYVISKVVDMFKFERDPRHCDEPNYQVRCPFCRDTKYHMHIDGERNFYNCFRCGLEKSGGNATDLYARLTKGERANDSNYKKMAKEMLNAIGKNTSLTYQGSSSRPNGVIPEDRAPDEILDMAYNAVLDFKYFTLTSEHHQNLIKRGLDDDSIVRNKYRSATGFGWIKKYQKAQTAFRDYSLRAAFDQFPSLRKYPDDRLIAGMVVARKLEQDRVSMVGVPGFFQITTTKKGEDEKPQKFWVFRVDEGMLIPTRNQYGQIVGMQVRKDYGKLRYKTVSSKGLPRGVTRGIARIHFSLSNAEFSENTKVLLTEGPLKADIALHLMNQKNVAVIALQGVNNRNGLSAVYKYLRAAGVKTVYNALDMDKLTNFHVGAASKLLCEMAEKQSLQMINLYWDRNYARHKYLELIELCNDDVPAPERKETESDFTSLNNLSNYLEKHGIQHSIKIDEKGAEIKDYWSPQTKGIDDYLLFRKGGVMHRRL